MRPESGPADPGAAPEAGLDAELDALYRAPLSDFVARREALAKRLKASGSAEPARRVKSLRKPTAVAWAINRLHLESGGLAEVEAASAALRNALATARSADERRAAIDTRRRAVEAAVDATALILREAGAAESPTLLRRIERTILALAGAAGPDLPRAGRLDQELEPPGFEALADVALAQPTAAKRAAPVAAPGAASRGDPTRLPGRPRGEQAEAPQRASSAPAARAQKPSRVTPAVRAESQRERERERALKEAQATLDEAEARLERASAGVEAARTRIAEAENELRQARAEAGAARREIAAARARRDALRRRP